MIIITLTTVILLQVIPKESIWQLDTGEHTVNLDSTIINSNDNQKVVISKYEKAQLIPSATWLTIKTRKRRRPCTTPTAKLIYHRTAICVQ